jgi:hypothetical protein
MSVAAGSLSHSSECIRNAFSLFYVWLGFVLILWGRCPSVGVAWEPVLVRENSSGVLPLEPKPTFKGRERVMYEECFVCSN